MRWIIILLLCSSCSILHDPSATPFTKEQQEWMNSQWIRDYKRQPYIPQNRRGVRPRITDSSTKQVMQK